MTENTTLPWQAGTTPLMLAPMQGLTNRALRALFIEKVRPDVVFTEFVRVRPKSRKPLSQTDRLEISCQPGNVPLVVQLIGRDTEGLVAAAEVAQQAGAVHLNINMGCPYGRMSAGSAGGALLKDPEGLPELLGALRGASRGSFSVKLRAGYDDPQQVFGLLPMFEDAGVDFLILHPRTVTQKYVGVADHRITAEVVARTSLPVIANGDINSAALGENILEKTSAAGLMLGRQAISDPWLFERLRGQAPQVPQPAQRVSEVQDYLSELTERYQQIFCGDHQVLCKLKETLAFTTDPGLQEGVTALRRARTLEAFCARLEALEWDPQKGSF